MKTIRKILFFLNIVLAGITLLAYVSPYINPSTFWVPSMLGLVVPFLLLLNVLFVFYWLITMWKKSWLSLVCLLVGGHYISLTLSFTSPQKPESFDFSIASYNMNYAYGAYTAGTHRFNNEKLSEFSGFLKKELNPDILCAQESNRRIETLMDGHYPYTHVLDNLATSIYSRFPMIEKGTIDFGTRTNSCVWADLLIQNDTIRIYSLHLQSNKISREADQLVHDAETNKKFDLIPVKTILGKYRRYIAIRAEQANRILDHVNKSPYPVILAGDLNDPPVSYTHRILTHNRQDAFTQKGNGLGTTYAGNIPLLRIDNIIADNSFEIKSFQTIRKRYSDHYPVFSEISIK